MPYFKRNMLILNLAGGMITGSVVVFGCFDPCFELAVANSTGRKPRSTLVGTPTSKYYSFLVMNFVVNS
jgi:hypothetical protein